MEWVFLSLRWYGILFFLGIIFLPLTKKVFGAFPDSGYPFSKILSILFLSYSIFVLGILKILPFTELGIFITILFLAGINAFIFLKKERNKKLLNTSEKNNEYALIVFEEILFLVAFMSWVYVRGQEPSIRSLEKFMDFGFINSILHTRYFPPIDMWLSGSFPINYYYFGHLTGATLIKLINIKPTIGYNLILSTLFALGITSSFSLVVGIISAVKKEISWTKILIIGFIGSVIVNLGANLQTIYLFTTGYPNDHPIPFWQIMSGFNPAKYWYPNATRFIPFTIHEFPSYSYVVADLHGHVFDIPFVLLTLAVLFVVFVKNYKHNKHQQGKIFNFQFSIFNLLTTNYRLLTTIMFLGFLTAVHYMTNAFDGPIYLLLIVIMLFILFKFTLQWLFYSILLMSSFITFNLPFSKYFTPFVTGIGINCSPQFLTQLGRIGPFLFEKGNCQISPLWMLFILWGFFWINLTIFLMIKIVIPKQVQHDTNGVDLFILLLFSFGTFLIIIPEFFYIKDIYPAHFRANTMFKLGYQAFIMMGIASAYTLFRIKILKKSVFSMVFTGIFIFFFFLVGIYYFFAVPSYYGALKQPVQLDGSNWLLSSYPEDKEIIDYLNAHEKNQPVILEAQGDSYTDFERISAFTGLPTIAGWWVHEWLWRGSPTVISDRIPDVIALYESPDIQKTEALIKKYKIKYIVVSRMERQKYPRLNEEKFRIIGRLLLRSSNEIGALYQVN